MTETRATLYVPSPNPGDTSLSLGKEWEGTDWNSAGLCVNTDGRVWLSAVDSTNTSATSFTLHANGTSGDGQLLLQSLKSNVYFFSSDKTVITSKDSTLIAGAKGVRILAGHGDEYFIDPKLWDAKWYLAEDSTLNTVVPSETDPSSDNAATYIDRMEDLSDCWSIVCSSIGAGMLITEAVRAIAGVRGVGGSSSTVLGVTLLKQLTSVASGAVNWARIGTDEVAGLHLHGLSGVNMATLGFGTFYSAAGMNLAAAGTVAHIGWVEAAAIGGVSASVRASYKTDINGDYVEITAGKDLRVGAVSSSAKMLGETVQVGTVVPLTGHKQTPTTETKVWAMYNMEAYSVGDVEVVSLGDVEIAGVTTVLECSEGVVITGGTYEVSVKKDKISICATDASKIVVDVGNSVLADVSDMQLDVQSDSITLGTSSSCIKVDDGGVWQIKASSVKHL